MLVRVPPRHRRLGLSLDYAHADWMPAAEIARCRAVMTDAGLELAS